MCVLFIVCSYPYFLGQSPLPLSPAQECIPAAKEPAGHQPVATIAAGPSMCSLG